MVGTRLSAPDHRELWVAHEDRKLRGMRVGGAGVVAGDLGLLAVGGNRDHDTLTTTLDVGVELHLGAAGDLVVGVALGRRRGDTRLVPASEGGADEDGVQGHGGENDAQEEGHDDEGEETHEDSMCAFSLSQNLGFVKVCTTKPPRWGRFCLDPGHGLPPEAPTERRMVDPTGFEPVTIDVKPIEVTSYLHGPM